MHVHVVICSYLYTYRYTYINGYRILTCIVLHTHILAYLHAHIRSCIYTYIHNTYIYIHTDMNTYMHTCTTHIQYIHTYTYLPTYFSLCVCLEHIIISIQLQINAEDGSLAIEMQPLRDNAETTSSLQVLVGQLNPEMDNKQLPSTKTFSSSGFCQQFFIRRRSDGDVIGFISRRVYPQSVVLTCPLRVANVTVHLIAHILFIASVIPFYYVIFT